MPFSRLLPFARLVLPSLLLAVPAVAGLTERWSFNHPAGGAPDETQMLDSVSGAVATVQGNNAQFTGSALTIRGSTGDNTTTGERSAGFISSYVDLPNGIISSKTHLTIEIWATPHSAKNFMRVFDFGRMNNGFGGGEDGEVIDQSGAGQHPVGSTGSDCISLSFCVGTSLNSQRFIGALDGVLHAVQDTSLPTTAGTRYHYAVTFEDGAGSHGEAGGRMTWYRDAVQIATADVPFRLNQIEDVNNWLGRSMWSDNMLAHASYDECRLYDHVLTPEEIAASFAAGPDLIVVPVDPPVPDHLWVFNDGADSELDPGTTFTDTIGGMTATLRGNGGALTQTALRLPGATTGNQGANTISAYLDLPNGSVTQTASVTFEAWAAPLSSKNWQRLFDFGRCVNSHGSGAAPGEILDTATAPGNTAGYDNLSLTFNNGGNMNSQQLEGQHGGNPPQYSFSTAATVAGTKYHYAFVVEDTATGCHVRWYRDGVLQNSDDFPFHLTDIEDVNNWIGRSMYSGDSNSHMDLDELRIYRRALAPEEVAASHLAGPDPTIGPPEPLPPVPAPIHRWTFDGADGAVSSGTEFHDVATGEPAILLGNGATLSGNRLVLPGTTSGNQSAATISAYLSLRNGIVSEHPSLSIEAWAAPLSSKNWQRLFDFGNASVTANSTNTGEIVDGAAAPGTFSASDNLFLSLNTGNTFGSHRLASKLNGGAETGQNYDLSSATSAGTEYHYVITVEDGAGAHGTNGCRARWFRNGVLQGSSDLPHRLTQLRDFNNWIGRSNWSADSGSHLALNELRFHDRALGITEVLASYQAGADAVFAPPVAQTDTVTIHEGLKALVDVLANDEGSPIPSTLEIVTPPSSGSAEIRNGRILYTHAGGGAPDMFIYRVGNASGSSADGVVTIEISNGLRIDNPALAMPPEPPATSWQLLDALPGLVFSEPLCIASIPGDTKQMFVCERMAKIQRVADVTAAAPVKNVFLDLQQVIQDRTPAETMQGGANAEHGLLGMAFHPDHAANGYFYAAYTVRIGTTYYQRISRFRVDPSDPSAADPASELILLQQLDEGANHNGGDLHFGPDGYLYYAAGDEENSSRGPLNSQKVDGDFFAGIFRIDVDKKPGNPEPNPHPAIPTDGGVARFSVPADNPFIHTSLGGTWDGTYNGAAVANLGSVRTEFWATGLRHVWRMAFDPATGDLWAGDVGQGTYEEINKIEKGGNYGWAYREGAHDYSSSLGSAPPGFTSIDPFYEYVHTGVAGGDASLKGNSVVGGYVYRGNRFPSLAGGYFFSDSVSGHVWRMDTATGATTRIAGLPGAYGVISSQGLDPSNQDLLFCAYLSGRIMRLAASDSPGIAFPATLSETGLFADLADLTPAPGLLPYDPNLRFWSDHAHKRRWFAIPDPAAKTTWRREGPWDDPAGMLWVKHFDLALSRGNPATAKRLETRVLVKKDDGGAYGVSYRWNDEGTEAYLVEEAGVEFDVQIDDHGTPHTQRWQIPGRSSCLTCHGDNALSFHTRQLNKDGTIHGFTGNQIELLADHGYLANTPDPVDKLPFHVRPDETQYPLEQRVRSYFDVNCSYCHQDGGSVSGFWDGRESLTLEQTGLIMGHAVQDGGDSANRYIVPGDTAHSIVLHRMAATGGFSRMPPLGSSEIDAENVQLVSDWIANALPNRPLYDQWRETFFAAGDPQGGRDVDADGDGLTNYQEFLLGGSPLSGAGFWQAQVSPDDESPVIGFMRKAYRLYKMESTENFDGWSKWDLPELEHNYVETDTWTEIPFSPAEDGKLFFRFEVAEP